MYDGLHAAGRSRRRSLPTNEDVCSASRADQISTEGFTRSQKKPQERSESSHTLRSGKLGANSVGQSTVSSTPPRSRYDRSMSRERFDESGAFGRAGSRSQLRERSLPDPPRRYRQPPAELTAAADLRKTSVSDGSDDARRHSEPPAPPSPSWGHLPITPRVQQHSLVTPPGRRSSLRMHNSGTSSTSSTPQSVHLTESSSVPGSRAVSADAFARGLPMARFVPAAPPPAQPQAALKPRLSQLPNLSLPAPPQNASREPSPVPGAERDGQQMPSLGPAKLPDLRLPPPLAVQTSGLSEGVPAAASEDENTDDDDDSTVYEELASGLHVCKVPDPPADVWLAEVAGLTSTPSPQAAAIGQAATPEDIRSGDRPRNDSEVEGTAKQLVAVAQSEFAEEFDNLDRKHAAATKVQAAFRRKRSRELRQAQGRAASSPWEEQPAEVEEVAFDELGEAAEDILIHVDVVSEGDDSDEQMVRPRTLSLQSVPRSVGTSGHNLSLLGALADGHNARMVKRDVEACEELEIARVEGADLEPSPQVLGHSASSDKVIRSELSQDFDEGLLPHAAKKHPGVRAQPRKKKSSGCHSCFKWLSNEVSRPQVFCVAVVELPWWLRGVLLAMCTIVFVLLVVVLLRLYL
mmetsp:Transcript_20408/g.37145  ORF Transcript_20408/g.37145 Transcript_20408/m.37145 type:complete len:634 (+) Transcript_20408:85-1986(+)